MSIGWLFTNLLALSGVCYGWLNPFYGLMVFYAFSILRPTQLWFWESWPTERYSFYLAIATLIGWASKGFGDWSGLRGVKIPLFGFGLYLTAGLVTWRVTAISPSRAWLFLYPQITIGVMMLVTVSIVRDAKQIKIFAWVLTATLGYLAWAFNSQYLFDDWNRVFWNGFGGIDNNGVSMIMVCGVPLAFFMGIYDKRKWVKGLCLLAALLLIHEVLLTFSRGGQLGLCIVGAGIFFVALFHLPKKGMTILMAVVFVFLTLHLAGAQVREEFWSIFVDPEDRDASAASRFDTWGAAWRCMLDHPMGVGARNFNLVSQNYGLAANKSVHNLFLQTGADYGFIGMGGLMLFYLSSLFSTFFMTRTDVAKKLIWPRYIGHMVSVSLGGMLVCSVFIGMESVEVGVLIALLGLCATGHVNRATESPGASASVSVPELEQVPGGHESSDMVVAHFTD